MKSVLITIVCVTLSAYVCTIEAQPTAPDANAATPARTPRPAQPVIAERIALGEPNAAGALSVEEAIASQKSVKSFSSTQLDNSQLRQLVWAGQNVIEAMQTQAAPESGMPSMDMCFCLPAGVYRYNSAANTLDALASVDVRSMLAMAAKNEAAFQQAPCTIIIAGTVSPAAALTRVQSREMMMLAAGRISQTMELEAQSLGLGAVGLSSFDIGRVKRFARLSAQQEPVYMLAVGYLAGTTPDRAAKKQFRALLIMSGSDSPEVVAGIMDLLIAANIKTTIAQSGSSKVRTEWYQRKIQPDMAVQNVVVDDYDAVIVVGGTGDPGFTRDPTVLNIIRTAVNQGKIVGAAGDTTAVLANAGVINGVRVTGDRRMLLRSGAIYSEQLVETDQGIITALNDQQMSLLAREVIAALKAQNAPQRQQPIQQPTPQQPLRRQMY